MLDAGLKHLKRLKAKVDSSLVATNQWELTRCLEVIDLYNMAELIFLAALDRKESRGFRQRIDYPYSDPLLLGKMQITRQVGGKPVIEWSRVPHAL
jgi:succinate dehydrogenase/fumarate reductase flavoprotein subunit